jgi:hypothetical protein
VTHFYFSSGCGRACSSGFSRDVTFQWWQWERYRTGSNHLISKEKKKKKACFCIKSKSYVIVQFPTGLALAIEKKSRRIEISLYCLARAIESFFTCMAEVGYLPESKNLKRADVVIFSLSTAIIMHCYAQEREVFRSKYLNVLDWVFGVPPPPCETPRCKNS